MVQIIVTDSVQNGDLSVVSVVPRGTVRAHLLLLFYMSDMLMFCENNLDD